MSALRPLGPPRVSSLGAISGMCRAASSLAHPSMMSMT